MNAVEQATIYDPTHGGFGTECPVAGAPGIYDHPQVSVPSCLVSCGKITSAQDHQPESVAGTAVFDPMPCVSWVPMVEPTPCHLMVHIMEGKHPTLHLRHHLLVQLHTPMVCMPRASIPHCTPATIGLPQLPGHQMMAPRGRTSSRCR
jgi:hypothetical protein